MNGSDPKPLVLVVDDNSEYQERLIPTRLEELVGECLKAKDVETACHVAEKYAGHTDTPIRLVILDMHMPASEEHADIQEDAGIHVLLALQKLQLVLRDCKIVIFTAHESYPNCVESIKAGAYAYIPKVERHDEKGRITGGFDELIQLCERLLREKPTPAMPDDLWLERNYNWLCDTFPGWWVAFLDPKLAKKAGLRGPERDGLMILSDASYQEVRRTIIRAPGLLRELPPVVFVPQSSVKHAS